MHELELSNQFLSDWLFEINLNIMPFFDYLTDNFTSKLKVCDTVNQRLDMLYLMLKTLNQKPNKVSLKLKIVSFLQQFIYIIL